MSRQLALDVLKEDALVTFRAIIRSIEPGRTFTVNRIRSLLDAADIPENARGGLFAKACQAGLIEPVQTADGHDVYDRSTGESARGARVRIYRRCDA